MAVARRCRVFIAFHILEGIKLSAFWINEGVMQRSFEVMPFYYYQCMQ